jgi:hypothetical protein
MANARASERDFATPSTVFPDHNSFAVSKQIPCFLKLLELFSGSYSNCTLEKLHIYSRRARACFWSAKSPAWFTLQLSSFSFQLSSFTLHLSAFCFASFSPSHVALRVYAAPCCGMFAQR